MPDAVIVFSQEAVAIAKTIQDPEDAARRLLIEALQKGNF
jgi:hypothetical protein